MADFINREEAINFARSSAGAAYNRDDFYAYRALKDFIVTLISIPAADVVPVVHGHWDKPTKPFPHYDWKCSVCGCEEYRQIDSHGKYRVMKFCPNCGAKMDEE